MVSDAVTMLVGKARQRQKSVTFEVFPVREIVLLEVPPIFSVPPRPKSNILSPVIAPSVSVLCPSLPCVFADVPVTVT